MNNITDGPIHAHTDDIKTYPPVSPNDGGRVMHNIPFTNLIDTLGIT